MPRFITNGTTITTRNSSPPGMRYSAYARRCPAVCVMGTFPCSARGAGGGPSPAPRASPAGLGAAGSAGRFAAVVRLLQLAEDVVRRRAAVDQLLGVGHQYVVEA